MINSDCKEKTIYVCPTCSLNKKNNELPSLLLNSIISNTLICELCSKKYPIIEGVPVFYEEVNQTHDYSQTTRNSEDDRRKFYCDHYSGRSRKADLESSYLAKERIHLREFVENYGITGICLEIGCGTGIFADIVPNYIGLDYSLPSLLADGFQGYTRLATTAENIPLKSLSIELIFSFNTLEHVPKPELAFQEIDRLLVPGGYALLKPAWHCTQYNTKLLPVKSYSELSLQDKIHKFSVPLLKTRYFKLTSRLPKRIARRVLYLLRKSKQPTHLKYRSLTPYLGEDYFIADCDATADVDCHEAILWFESRGYEVISHPTSLSRLLSGHDLLILRKVK